eukprot:GEMP01076974.1.p1 GENE.GEMP01076974.1~~GEMP01076974.1.p1  ORF type:complete len:191 (+),score=27.70 GEMP01076974.1:215-787(+)
MDSLLCPVFSVHSGLLTVLCMSCVSIGVMALAFSPSPVAAMVAYAAIRIFATPTWAAQGRIIREEYEVADWEQAWTWVSISSRAALLLSVSVINMLLSIGGRSSIPRPWVTEAIKVVARTVPKQANYGGGIFAADGSDGVNCFRKASAPVSPTSRNGWETWGKISLAIIMIGVLFGIVHFLFAYFTRIGK